MSYDIRLLLVREGESIRELAYRDEIDEEACTPEQRGRNRKIVDALVAAYPDLERFESDDHVELSDEQTGLQVSLFNTSGAVTLPYWHGEDRADVLRQVDDVLSIIFDNSPFAAFDPQTGQELTRDSGVGEAGRRTYAAGVATTRKIGTKPWWRFWQ
jgi:hypothetical protein